jgi:hypothetical protein
VPAHHTQQRIFADWQHQPPRQSRGKAAAQGNAEMVDNRLQPRRAPSRSAGHRVIEPLGEDAAPATALNAAKSANRDPQLNRATVRRQVEEAALVPAVHPLGLAPAIGARASGSATLSGDEDAIWPDLDVIDQQARGRQWLEAWIHHGKRPLIRCLPNLA